MFLSIINQGVYRRDSRSDCIEIATIVLRCWLILHIAKMIFEGGNERGGEGGFVVYAGTAERAKVASSSAA